MMNIALAVLMAVYFSLEFPKEITSHRTLPS